MGEILVGVSGDWFHALRRHALHQVLSPAFQCFQFIHVHCFCPCPASSHPYSPPDSCSRTTMKLGVKTRSSLKKSILYFNIVFKLYCYLLCTGVLVPCMATHHMCAWCLLLRSEEGIRSWGLELCCHVCTGN